MSERIGIVPFWKSYDRKAVLRLAQLAEDLGYDSIWIPEAWAYEQFQLLTEIALSTKTIGLATGIANVFSRSPGLLAMSAATLDEISGGRAILGLGTIEKTPVVINDAIAIRSICYLALTFDHRLIDGALADMFTGRIKQILENWTDTVI